MRGFSLQDLIDNMGGMNEINLNKMALQILNSLSDYTDKFNEDFGEFCPCDVLFDKEGNIKVYNNYNGS